MKLIVYFAGLAMQEYMQLQHRENSNSDSQYPPITNSDVAQWSFDMAEEMVSEFQDRMADPAYSIESGKTPRLR